MLTPETLATLLHAVVTGYPDRALNLVATTDELPEEAKSRLWPLLDRASDPSATAKAVGDVLRGLGAPGDLVNECYRAAFYAGDGPSRLASNPLFAQFLAKKGGLVVDKWPHYFEIYDRHLSRWRGTPVRVLEIGTFRGGGLDLLREYLGPHATLVGMDIDPIAVEVASARHTVVLGDQTDPDQLLSVADRFGPFDVVIDDGGHTMEQQIASITTLLPLVTEGGVYIVEDTHTSYWEDYGGGLGREGTFVEWAKDRLDDVHAYHWSSSTPPAPFADLVSGLHVYDSVVVLDRGRGHAPFAELSGTWDFLNISRRLSVVQSELVATRDVALRQLDETRKDLEVAKRELSELSELRDAADALKVDLENSWEQLRAMRRSTSWRLTAPVRWVRRGR